MPFPFKPKHKTVEILVGEDEKHDVVFVPVQLKFLYPLKALGKQIADSVGHFGSAKKMVEGKRQDVAKYNGDEQNKLTYSEVNSEPVAEARIEKAAAMRKRGIEQLIGLFLEEDSLGTLTDLIASSLRANDGDWALTGKQLKDEADIDLIAQLTIGLVEAHQSVLDPLLRMRGLAATASGADNGDLSLVADPSGEEDEELES